TYGNACAAYRLGTHHHGLRSAAECDSTVDGSALMVQSRIAAFARVDCPSRPSREIPETVTDLASVSAGTATTCSFIAPGRIDVFKPLVVETRTSHCHGSLPPGTFISKATPVSVRFAVTSGFSGVSCP